jgi:plasmid stability protein
VASKTIRNLDDDVKRRLRVGAAEYGRSMVEEACDILPKVVGQPSTPRNLGQSIHQRFAALGGADLALPVRTPMPAAPDLE